jgi:hypothetical protein
MWLVFTDDDTLPDRGWLAGYAAALSADPRAEALEGRTTCAAGFGDADALRSRERARGVSSGRATSRCARTGSGTWVGSTRGSPSRTWRTRTCASDCACTAWARGCPTRWWIIRRDGSRPGGGSACCARPRCATSTSSGAPRPVRWRLLRGVASLRIGIVRSLPWSVDSLHALASLAAELTDGAAAWRRVGARGRRGVPGADHRGRGGSRGADRPATGLRATAARRRARAMARRSR